jgi:hypothetical protein
MKKLSLSWKTHWGIIFVLGSIVLALAMLGTSSTGTRAEEHAGPQVITPDYVAFGRTYGEWSAAWNQWADSIPASSHPLFDTADCSTGQSGPVWFLGGKFCAIGATCSYIGVNRNCKLPYGKALFFPVIDYEDSALEESQLSPGDLTKQQIAGLRAVTAAGMDGVSYVFCSVDGESIPGLLARHRVQSAAFGFTIPDYNLFRAIGEGFFTSGAYFPAVDDGWYVMLAPLPPGPHVIHFQGSFSGGGSLALDITYHLHVAR